MRNVIANSHLVVAELAVRDVVCAIKKTEAEDSDEQLVMRRTEQGGRC